MATETVIEVEAPEEAKLSSVAWTRSHRQVAKEIGSAPFVVGVECNSLAGTVSGYLPHAVAENLFMFARGIKNGKSPRQAFVEAFGE